MKKEILINATEFETRIAILEDDLLVELMVELPDTQRLIGDIYKGKIKSVLPGMQAAFVDIGLDKAAYLHASDIGATGRYEPDDEEEDSGIDIVRKHRRAGIETVLKVNQEILVQVIKEPIATKGPRIASDISIPGRYLVMIPDDDKVRVSKRIADWNEKKRLRKLVTPLRPEGFGFIVRTEASGADEKDIEDDIKRLQKLWVKLKKKADSSAAPALIHKEGEMILATIRDLFSDEVQQLLIDDRETYKKVHAFVRSVMPHLRDRVKMYVADLPIFDKYGLEPEIDKMLSRKVWIKKGAYLVIDQTEAMVTIDVNTGRFVGTRDAEATLFQTNTEAAKEIARQIRLRDMGGLIVCDFIDMKNRENRRKLSEEFHRAFRNDRAKRAMNPVTEFGLIELTRERVRPSHMARLSEPCPCCDGIGRIVSKENLATKIDRWFMRAKAGRKYKSFHLVIHPDLATMMIDGDIDRVERLMKSYKFKINVIRDTTQSQAIFLVYNAEENVDITSQYLI